MKRYWLLPSKHDPRNRLCAKYAGVLAAVQWVFIVGFFISAPTSPTGNGTFNWAGFISGMAMIQLLMLVGYRGVISGQEERMGALILLATNAFWFLHFTGMILTEYYSIFHSAS
jgi:hypothetical protein